MYSIPAMALLAGGGLGAAWVGLVAGGGWVLRMAPMMKKRVPMPKAEMKRDRFRPRVSTPKKMKIVVATTLTMPGRNIRRNMNEIYGKMYHRHHWQEASFWFRCIQSSLPNQIFGEHHGV